MNYPISKVVGGFGRDVTPEEAIPYTLARTFIEHKKFKSLASEYHGHHFNSALEVGCGYGRMIPIVAERSIIFTGYERDPKLAAIASSLYANTSIHIGPTLSSVFLPEKTFDFIYTFTVLQHMDGEVMMDTVDEIKRLLHKGGTIILVEETDKVQAKDLWGRSISMYQLMMEPEFKLVHSEPRYLEPGNPYKTGGHYMVFR
jgi:SAM-dependent methyltransferase